MHERTERALCRLAFLVLCALPTCATILLTLVTWTPWYYRSQISKLESALEQRLGVSVSIGDLYRPSPDAWQLENIELRDPETKAKVATVRTAFYAVVDGNVRLHLSQPEIQTDQLSLVWRLVHDRFLCQPDLLGKGLRLRAQDLSLISQPVGLTLSPVDIWIEPREDETRATAQFWMAGWNAAEKPAALSVTRVRGGSKPRTHWELRTGSNPLPCSVLAEHLPVMRLLGVDAEFRGLMRWQLDRDDYSVVLHEAQFTNVNMLDLFEPLNFHVSGKGTIELQSLTRHSGHPISQAIGSLTIEGGRVEAGLLRRLANSFQAQLALQQIPDSERIACQMVATEFRLYGDELQVIGICHKKNNYEAAKPGTAIVANNRALMFLDPRYRISSTELTSTVDPNGRIGLPIGDQANWVRGLLPDLRSEQTPEPSANTPPSIGNLRLNRE
jgi:hypothetical protein